MKTHHDVSTGELMGAALARALRRLLRQERRVIAWLVSTGWSSTVAKCVVRAVQFVALAGIAYAAGWFVLLLLFALVAAYVARSAEWESDDHPQPEWRSGSAGHGLYTYDEHRIDPHVYDDD